MSFVKKAVKKVFKFGKRLIKKTISFGKRLLKNKYFQIALVIAASVFTAGLASGGFAAFSGVNSVGGFFSAVGSTISTGFSAITSVVTGQASFAQAFPAAAKALGAAAPAVTGTTANTSGVLAAGAGAPLTGSAAAATGAAGAETALLSGGAKAITGSALANAGVGAGAGITAAAPAAAAWTVPTAGLGVGGGAPTGFFGKMGSLLMDKGLGGTMMRGGIMMGIQGYYRQKELEKQEYYYRNRTVWGNAAYGSDGKGLRMLTPSWSKNFAGEQKQGGLLSAPQTKAPSVYDTAQQQPAPQPGMLGAAPTQAAPGVPGQQTQAPPATQPQQGLPTPGAQLENMGVA